MKTLLVCFALSLVPGTCQAQSNPLQKPVFQEGQIIAPLYRSTTEMMIRDPDGTIATSIQMGD